MQCEHADFNKHYHNLDINIVCDGLDSPANVGAVLRLADAYGVSKVFFLGGVDQLTSRAKSVSRGVQKYVNYEFLSNFEFDNRDWFCLELTSNSQPLSEFMIESKRIGLIIGNENSGVQEKYLNKFKSYHIKMYGNNSSMNVSNALSVALYELTR